MIWYKLESVFWFNFIVLHRNFYFWILFKKQIVYQIWSKLDEKFQTGSEKVWLHHVFYSSVNPLKKGTLERNAMEFLQRQLAPIDISAQYIFDAINMRLFFTEGVGRDLPDNIILVIHW